MSPARDRPPLRSRSKIYINSSLSDYDNVPLSLQTRHHRRRGWLRSEHGRTISRQAWRYPLPPRREIRSCPEPYIHIFTTELCLKTKPSHNSITPASENCCEITDADGCQKSTDLTVITRNMVPSAPGKLSVPMSVGVVSGSPTRLRLRPIFS